MSCSETDDLQTKDVSHVSMEVFSGVSGTKCQTHQLFFARLWSYSCELLASAAAAVGFSSLARQQASRVAAPRRSAEQLSSQTGPGSTSLRTHAGGHTAWEVHDVFAPIHAVSPTQNRRLPAQQVEPCYDRGIKVYLFSSEKLPE